MVITMNQERDKYLTEAMGACWHRYDIDKFINTYSLEAYICETCKAFILGNNDFAEAEDFAKLWKWAGQQERLRPITSAYSEEDLFNKDSGRVLRERFADELSAFLKGAGR